VNETPDLIGTVEAAEILGVERSTITRWSDSRLKPEERRLTVALRLGGPTGAMLFRRADVEALAAELAGEAS
jgi:hypothetical protein